MPTNDEIDARAWRQVQPELTRITRELQQHAHAIQGNREPRLAIVRLAGELIGLSSAAEFERTGNPFPLNLPE